jgi:hypothetical protein
MEKGIIYCLILLLLGSFLFFNPVVPFLEKVSKKPPPVPVVEFLSNSS